MQVAPPTTTIITTTMAHVAATAMPAPEPGSFWWPWGVLIALGASALGLAGVAMMCMSQEKKPKKSRAVKPVKAKDPPPPEPPLPPPQPVVPLVTSMIMQPTVQPTIMQSLAMAQPAVATYAAPAAAYAMPMGGQFVPSAPARFA